MKILHYLLSITWQLDLSFASAIVKVEAPTKLDRIKFRFHVNNDLQKLLKYFSGMAIFTPFFPVIRLDLYLIDDKLFGIWLLSTVKSTSRSTLSLLNCHKLPTYQHYYHRIHRYCKINVFCFINKGFTYFCFTFSEWWVIFKCNFCNIISSYNSNISCN